MTVTNSFTAAQKASLLRHIDAGAALSGTLQSVPRLLRESGWSDAARPMVTGLAQRIHHKDCAGTLDFGKIRAGTESIVFGMYFHSGGAKGVINADRERRRAPNP